MARLDFCFHSLKLTYGLEGLPNEFESQERARPSTELSIWKNTGLPAEAGTGLPSSRLRRATFAIKSGLPTEAPKGAKVGAGEGIRTLDPDLGKVVLYP